MNEDTVRTEGHQRRPLRRVAAALAIVSVTSLAAAALVPARSSADAPGFSNGTAAATAQGVRINPTAAQLSLGISFAVSLTGYTNQVAKSEARGIDLGEIGATLAAAGCDGGKPTLPQEDQPNPLTVDSRDAGAAQGQTQPETVFKSPLPGITKYARATADPFGESRVDDASLNGSGVFDISGVRTDSVVHILGGNTREAVATSDIGLINIGGGQVVLRNLHWEAIHHSGADSKPTTVFSIGSATIGGQAVPTGDPSAAMAAANQALGAIGIELRAPTVQADDRLVTIGPLSVGVVPNSTRDSVSGAVIGAALPARQALVDALLKATCHTSDVTTIADLVVGSITGSGSLSLELGGVQAGSGELHFFNGLDFSLAQNALDNGVAATPAVPGEPGSSGGAPTAVATGTYGAVVGTTGTGGRPTIGGRQFARPIAAHGGSRGGMLAAVGGIGLLLMLAAVEGDRRMMRRAQRMIL